VYGAHPYDGWLWYSGGKVRRLPWFSLCTERPEDLYWTLNETEIHMQRGEQPDTLAVQLDTVTPNLDTYLIRRDGGEWGEASAIFTWELHAGENVLEAKTRNRFGVEGIASKVVVAVVRDGQ
jgi:hypothetical protein